MSDGQSKRLDEWVRRQLFNQKSKVTKFLVIQLIKGNREGNRIHTIDIEPSEVDPDKIEDVVREIETACISDAEALSDFQKYAVQSFTADSEKSNSRMVLKYNIRDEFDSDDLDSEGANKTGLLSQTMRHCEAIMKISVQGTGTVIAMQGRTIDTQARQIEHLTQKHLELMTAREDLISQKHERDLLTSTELTKQELLRDGAQKLMLLAPMVVNKLAGKKVFESAETPEGQMFKAFLGSIKEDQYQKLTEIFTAEQNMVLSGALIKIQQDDEAKKKEEASKRSANGGIQLVKKEVVEIVNGE